MNDARDVSNWSTVCLYLHRRPEDVDRFLLRVVAPVARAGTAVGAVSSWHYLRYWDGGPHVRVRFRDADPRWLRGGVERFAWVAEQTAQCAVLVDEGEYYAGIAAAPSQPWCVDGTVVHLPYVPESDRYGGDTGVALAESFFALSSELSLETLAGVSTLRDRLELGYELMALSLVLLSEHGYDPRKRFGLRRDRLGEVHLDHSQILRDAAALQKPGALYGFRLPRIEGSPPGAWKKNEPGWRSAITGVLANLAALHRVGALRRPADDVFASLMHMNNNRLGLTMHEELVLTTLAVNQARC